MLYEVITTFSVVGSETSSGGRDKEIVEPVVMIDPTIKFVSWRDIVLTDFGSGTVRPEIMKQSPSPDL